MPPITIAETSTTSPPRGKKLIHEKLNGDVELCVVAKLCIGPGRQRTQSDLDEAEEQEGEEQKKAIAFTPAARARSLL